MKSVLYIVTSLTLGGAETLVVNLSNGITEFKPIILAMEDRKNAYYKDFIEKSGVSVLYANSKKKRFLLNNYRVYKLIKKLNPDVIHINDSILAKILIPIVLLRKSKNTVYTIHTDPRHDGKGYRRILNIIALKLFKIKFVAINHKNLMESRKFYNDDNIYLIENGVHLEKYLNKKTILENDKVKFIHVGRFNGVKNHSFLIDVFNEINKEYKETSLHLLGDGPLRGDIEQKVKKLNLNDKIVFHGNVSNVPELLNESDVFLFPSIYEGSPLSIIEALAAGLPIVASDRGGIPGLVENNVNGYLCDLKVEDFKNSIKNIIENKNLYNAFKINNINKSKDYDIKITISKYEALYKLLLI